MHLKYWLKQAKLNNVTTAIEINPIDLDILFQYFDKFAKELNIPLGTVKAQLFRAKEILYNILQSPGAQAYLEQNPKHSKRYKRRMQRAASVS